MGKIPKVKQEIKYSLYKTIKRMSQDKKQSYLTEFWKEFKRDQPELAEIVLSEMEAFRNPMQMGAFAHGVWLIYAALNSQLEADEMNEDWGI